MPTRIHTPRKNFGTIGFELSDDLYFDFFVDPYFGIFFRYKKFKASITVNYTKWFYREYGLVNFHKW